MAPRYQHPSVTNQMKWFVYGVIVSCVAAASAYITTYCGAGASVFRDYTWEHPFLLETNKSKRYSRVARGFHLLGFIPAIVGVVIFSYGLYKVQKAIATLT